ncbi:hypothetical protein KUTeg_020173 [Tegillarca granosa]|uniref:Uncharacterized protein n=1 Tax=Tegillarca granosa TaxID=220873 RepID=A0ABQ9E9U9_TEGGR|nr:hypothetical protein KUTeg_020173 [Tegillarca granosa]
MGIKALQDFIETHCSSACVSVDLLKISKGFVPKRRGRYPGNGRFCLVVDAESCLDRLYGGFFSDWVYQVNTKRKVSSVLRHINNRGTPPPKVWWVQPVFLQMSLRMALREMGVGVACSMDDHAQEVIGYCREHGLQGIIAQDSVYTIFDPPRYFSSHNLKLTYKGSLETKEYIMDEIAKCLDLNPNRFCIFAAMLGNHILPDEDLYEFYKELLGRTQEPSKPIKITPENAIRAAVDFVRSLPTVDNLDLVGDAIFRNTTKNKQELIAKFKQCVQYYLNGTQEGFLKYRPYIRICDSNFCCVKAVINGGFASEQTPGGSQLNVQPPDQTAPNFNAQQPDMLSNIGPSASNNNTSSPTRASPDAPGWPLKPQNKGKGGNMDSQLPPVTPEIMRIASERHQKGFMIPWIYQLLSQGEIKINVALEDDIGHDLPTSVELYRPVRQTIYSVLFNLNKLKIIQESQKDKGGDFPGKGLEVNVKEWVIRRGNTRPSFDMVKARPVDWKTPSIERMWLGTQVDDKTRRLRAFLTCMGSDSPLMLNTQYVPQQFLVMCCVLRQVMIMSNTDHLTEPRKYKRNSHMEKPCSGHNCSALLKFHLPNVLPRGVHLASLFMAGVETAVFANDVCGAPIPWNICAPWNFFDGKLFHFKLLKANNNTPLIDMCDGQLDQVLRVERMRQAIMEGLQCEFAKPMLPPQYLYTHYPYPPAMNYRPAGAPGYPPPMGRGVRPGPPMPPGVPGGMGMPGPKSPGRGRGILGRSPIDARGGQLEIAGVTVASWGPNLSSGAAGGGRDVGRRPPNMGGNGLSPRVMSVGNGPRRFQRGGMQGMGGPMRGMGGPNMRNMMGRGSITFRGPLMSQPVRPPYGYGRPMRFQSERPYFRGRGVVRGVRRPQIRVRPRPGGKKTTKKPGKGRGVTVEESGDSEKELNDVVNGDVTLEGKSDEFQDAEEPPMAKIPDGLQSPDSGIHGDKSATELNVTA